MVEIDAPPGDTEFPIQKIDSPAFRRAALESERLRIQVLIGVLLALLAAVLVRTAGLGTEAEILALPKLLAGAVVFLAPSDFVVLLTDGFFEWAGPRDEQFGLERLKAAVQAARDLPAHELIAKLYSEVRGFARRINQQDDLTAVVIKRTGLLGIAEDEGVRPQ